MLDGVKADTNKEYPDEVVENKHGRIKQTYIPNQL
jgi:hypothetical protein